MYPIEDPTLLDIWHRLEDGQRLQEEDGAVLFQTRDITGLGWMAGRIRYSWHGNAAYFVHNRQINPSNICTLKCRFCRFSKDVGDPGAYDLEISEILSQLSPDLTEVHVVGSLNPNRGWEYYLELIGSIHQRLPMAGIKAWTAVEIDYFSRKFGMPAEEVLKQFQERGLTMLAGGGAEIFSKRVRDILCPQKINAGRWLEIHRIAHQTGIKTNATMLYGHVETPEERVEHLLCLRSLQDETGGFQAFIPLAFQPGDSGIVSRRVSPVEDLKTIAASRLLLDNVPHIKAYWIMLGEETTAMALHFGADDLDGTIGEEKIAHAALAPSPPGHSREELVNTILAAEMLPVERDSAYNIADCGLRIADFEPEDAGYPDRPLTRLTNSNLDSQLANITDCGLRIADFEPEDAGYPDRPLTRLTNSNLDPQSIADCGLRIADFEPEDAGYPDRPLTRLTNSNLDSQLAKENRGQPIPQSEIRNPKSEIGTIRNPKSEIGNRNDPKSVIVGKINYLNAVPFYLYLTGPHFYSLPLSPSLMGEFAGEGLLDAGPFSLMDYFSLKDEFQLMDFCIAARDRVRSVILFSKKPIEELDGARIGITTETSTSVRLLELLLKKRYGLQPQLERLSDCGLRIAHPLRGYPGLRSLDSDSFPGYDAVLLIGDKALKGMADCGLRIADCGIKGRPQLETRYQYDLATLWWEWMRLPFVFAVWSVRASLPENIKSELHQRLEESLEAAEQNPGRAVLGYRHRLGLEENEVIEYLKGFFYRLGEKEREAINTFRTLILPFQH